MHTEIINGTLEFVTANNEQYTIYIEKGSVKVRKDSTEKFYQDNDTPVEPQFDEQCSTKVTESNIIYPALVVLSPTRYITAFGDLQWDRIIWKAYSIDTEKKTVVSTEFEGVSVMGDENNKHIARIKLTKVDDSKFIITYCRNKSEFIAKVGYIKDDELLYVGPETILGYEFADEHCIVQDGITANRYYCVYSTYAGTNTWDLVPVVFDVEGHDISIVFQDNGSRRKNVPFHVSGMEGMCTFRYTDRPEEGYTYNGTKLCRFSIPFTKFSSQKKNLTNQEYTSDIAILTFNVYYDEVSNNNIDVLLTNQTLYPFKGKVSKDRLNPKNVGYLLRALFRNRTTVLTVAVADRTIRLVTYCLNSSMPIQVSKYEVTVDGIVHYAYTQQDDVYILVLKNRDIIRYKVKFLEEVGDIELVETGSVLDMFKDHYGVVTGNSNDTKWTYTSDETGVVLANVFRHKPKTFSFWIHNLQF